jgi:hypothetical protein
VANKHTVIVIISIIIIAAALVYSSLGAVFANDLQIRWNQTGSFDLLSIMFGGKVVVCNDSDYPISFHQYSFNIIYDGQDLGTFSAQGASLLPHTSTEISGEFTTDDKRIAQILFASLDTAFSGSEQAARIDTKKMSATTTLDTRIIGIIPISITQEYAGQEFIDMMNQKTSCDQ